MIILIFSGKINKININGLENDENVENSDQNQSYAGCSDFTQVLSNVAMPGNSEIVYAFDKDGKQVAVGLIVDGKFNEDDVCGDNGNIEWVGAQEECVDTACVDLDQVKYESVNECPEKITGEKTSSVVKIYKSRKHSRKTLKEVKLQVTAHQKMRNSSKGPILKSAKPKGSSRPKHIVMPVKRRRKVNVDKAYRPPASWRNHL